MRDQGMFIRKISRPAVWDMVPAMAGAEVVDSAGEEAAGDRVEAWAGRTASGVASDIA